MPPLALAFLHVDLQLDAPYSAQGWHLPDWDGISLALAAALASWRPQALLLKVQPFCLWHSSPAGILVPRPTAPTQWRSLA
jgi:hypothetical protein